MLKTIYTRYLSAIANAIREVGGTTQTYTPPQMAPAIRALKDKIIIDGGGIKPKGTLQIKNNGIYDVYTYANVEVDTGLYPEPTDSIQIVSNGTFNVKDFANAIVKVPKPVIPDGEKMNF